MSAKQTIKEEHMKALSKTKLSDLASQSIVQFMIETSMKPGDKLPTEKEIGERLDIGRTSVREGIRQLEAVGLLEGHQGDGIYVKEVTLDSYFKMKERFSVAYFMNLSKKEILHLLDTRLVLESYACEMAAANITDDQRNLLERNYLAMASSLDKREAFIQHDLEFHRAILKASGNIIFPKIFDMINDLYARQLIVTADLPEAMERALVFHSRICEALLRKDGNEAARVMRDHLTDMKSVFSNSTSKE